MSKHNEYTVLSIEAYLDAGEAVRVVLRALHSGSEYRLALLHVLSYAPREVVDAVEKALAYLIDEERHLKWFAHPPEERQVLIDNWEPLA